ncbi:odorant receptor 22c-like [Odontomachus brunneus]|uniref:odorant receptor 22c-like n=1 Tax=Odontomachus brunneus TaxID=486640 RepID=UPI0013F26BA3|nr:odorant receptor 22c-like [Odontomachus brunneus]
MPYNENSLYDIMYITQPTRNIMSILGIWPSINKKKTLCKRVYKFLLITVSYTLLICNLIPIFLYWMIQGDTRTRIQMAPFLVYDAMTVSQYSIFIFRDDQIRQCLKHVQEDWENILSADVRTLMLKFARITKRIIIVSASFMFSGAVLIRTILPLLQGNIITEQNVTIRPLVCPSYLVFIDVQATPIYEIYFTIQFVSGLIIASIATGACGLTAIFVIHASGQLRILRDLMTNLVEEQWQRECEVNKKLADIVEHQMRVRGFLRMVQHTLQQIFLTGMTVNTLTLCILMYFIIIEWQNSNTTAIYIYILCVGDVAVHLFMYCYTGEQLTEQAEKVAIVSCELEWYRLPNRKARCVVLLMIMSNAPTKISAGNFFDLSLKTFGDAIKTAGAYFNMLRNVID